MHKVSSRHAAASIQDDDKSVTPKTLVSKNNVNASIPVDFNFAEKQTIIELFECMHFWKVAWRIGALDHLMGSIVD